MTMSEAQIRRWMLSVVAFVAFATYSTTMCRTIYWGDGVELTAVATILGIAHPPGYPFFSLLGKIFVQLPLGTIAFRMNLMSAATATILAVLVASILWRLLPMLGLIKPDRFLARAILSAAAAWTVAFSRTFWCQAGLTEVYLLNAAIFAGILLLLLLAMAERDKRWFLAAVLLTGLGFGNHTTMVLLVPALALVGVWLELKPRKDREARKRRTMPAERSFPTRLVQLAGFALLLGALGASIYAYLPLRAAKNPPLNWGDPSTARNFLWSIRGGEFRNVFLLKAAPHVPFSRQVYLNFLQERVNEWLAWTGAQIIALPREQTSLRAIAGLLLLVGAARGWWIVARRRVGQVANPSNDVQDRRIRKTVLAVVLLLAAMPNLIVAAVYSIPDIEGYFFPSHVVAVVCLFVALTALHQWTETHLLAGRSDVLAALFLALPIAAWLQGRPLCDRSYYDAAERYGREVMDRLPADAMILTGFDYDIEPLWYQQIVEHRRRDVVVLGTNFLATPGYAKYFQGRYDPPVRARFLDRTPYYEEWLKAMAEEIVANMQHRPLYATPPAAAVKRLSAPGQPQAIFETWFSEAGVEGDSIEIPVLRETATLDIPERKYFMERNMYPWIYRLRKAGAKP